jgi:DNA-binding NarL/FixJ family response regulator
MNLKVIVIDDHKLFRMGLVSLISNFKNISVVQDVSSVQELFLPDLANIADVVLLDISGVNGFDDLIKINSACKGLKVLAIALNEGDNYIARALESGASGYLHKGAEPLEVEQAIQDLATSGVYFNEVSNRAMFKRLVKRRRGHTSFASQDLALNATELNVLRYLCQELTSSEIASKMFLSRRTVEGIRQHLISKTGVRNVVGLVLFAAKYGIIEMDS